MYLTLASSVSDSSSVSSGSSEWNLTCWLVNDTGRLSWFGLL